VLGGFFMRDKITVKNRGNLFLFDLLVVAKVIYRDVVTVLITITLPILLLLKLAKKWKINSVRENEK
jgi:hypothetical protein